MKTANQRQRRGTAALWVAAVVLVGAYLVPPSVWGQSASVEPSRNDDEAAPEVEVEIPEEPEVETPVPEPDVAPTTRQDSIYAKEITIDNSGVTVVDREGRRYSVMVEEQEWPPRPPKLPRGGIKPEDIIHVFTDVLTIEEDEVIRGDVVCIFGGDVEVLGRVTGTVFTFTGSINVEGTIDDAAAAPFGTVRIAPNGVVGGDVVASHIDKEPGGRIGGLRNELFFKLFGDRWQPRGARWAQTTLTIIVVLKILFWIFLVLLAHALAARNVAKVKDKIQTSFFKSFLVGILVQILFLPAMLLLIVTIVGIPVAIFLVPLLVVAAAILTQAAIGLYIGEKIHQNTSLNVPSPLAQTLVGLLAVQTVPLLAVVFAWGTGINFLSGSFRLAAFGFVALSMIIGYVIWTLGTGAVVMTRFGTRPRDSVPGSESAEPDGSAEPRPDAKPTPLPGPPKDEPGTAPATG